MANACYDIWKNELMKGSANTNLSSGTVKQTFADITSAYAFSQAHDFVDDLGANDNPNYGAAVSLANKTFTASVMDADDVVTPALTGAADMGSIILYVDSGTEATSRLVLFLDTGITGAPFTPSGADVTVQWNASGIFKL